MRGATDGDGDIITLHGDFNSHTPCGVRRGTVAIFPHNITDFNSHTPCGVRQFFEFLLQAKQLFQLTHPMRGATAMFSEDCSDVHFNSHTPCGVRLIASDLVRIPCRISTHTPHAGCDGVFVVLFVLRIAFQLTHPMRGATIRYISYQIDH